MPQIKQYENPVQGIHATETGVEATAQAARRGSQIFKESAMAEQRLASETSRYGQEVEQAGRLEGHMYETAARSVATGLKDAGDAAVDYMNHKQITDGGAAYTSTLENLTNAWNQTVKNADPGDPALQQKFMQDQVEPALDTFRQGFWTEKGQQFAENRIEAARNHFFEKTTADMGTMAQVNFVAKTRQMANAASNTAMADPSSVPHLLDTIETTVDAQIASTPGLKGVAAVKARTEMVQQWKEGIIKAGAFGAIQSSGDPVGTAAAWAAKYPDFINGPEEKTLAKAAMTQERFNIAQAKAIQVYNKQLHVLDFQQKATELMAPYMQPGSIVGGDYWAKAQTLAKNEGATTGEIKTLRDYGIAVNREDKAQTSDPNTMATLQTQLLNNDPNSSLSMARAYADHNVTDKDMGRLKEIQQLHSRHRSRIRDLKLRFQQRRNCLLCLATVPTSE